MHLFSFILLLIAGSVSLTQGARATDIDPDLVDVEMIQVMYLISPNDLKTSIYKDGSPSVFNIKLCPTCQIRSYQLKDQAELLLHDQPLALKDLTITLLKKKFDEIQLGINRSNKTVTYLYLGGISESSAEELLQEKADEN